LSSQKPHPLVAEQIAIMSHLNSWEDDPAAQDENLSRQTQQQLNMNPAQSQGGFRPGVASFQPGAQSFTPGQAYGGGYGAGQYQQQQYYQQQQGFYPQYGGQQQGYNQYQQYGGGFSQGYNQGYGKICFLTVWISEAYEVLQAVGSPNTVSKMHSSNLNRRLNSPLDLPPRPPPSPRNPHNVRPRQRPRHLQHHQSLYRKRVVPRCSRLAIRLHQSPRPKSFP
jgi:hypothetical protein